MSMAVGIFGGGGSNGGGGGGDVSLESNHQETLTTNGTHVVTPNEGYDGMRKATISVDVEAADPADKALVNNATQYGLSHNLYKVMEQVKKDPRTSGYAAIMLCQYYKGYSSLSLEGGADAFLTSDGNFYVGNTTHYWHDANDEYFDRWVAMLFSSESGNYTCSNASICPRAALIDGTMGDINITATNMRFNWIDVTEGSSWGQWYSSGSFTNAWNRQAIVRGMREYKKALTTGGTNLNLSGATSAVVSVSIIAKSAYFIADNGNTLTMLRVEKLSSVGSQGAVIYGGNNTVNALQRLECPNLVSCSSRFIGTGAANGIIATNLRYVFAPSLVYIGYFCGTSSVATTGSGYASLIHFEIGKGFYSNLNLRMCTFANCLLTDANDLVEDVVAHTTWSNLDQWLYNFEHLIVDKLADLSGQTAKTITLAAAPYAAITESIRAKMSAKNWNLASA